MSAQPLSSINPSAAVYTQPSPFENAPHLVIGIARAIAKAADIESEFGNILVTMLGASAPPAAAMVQALTSTASTRAAIRAAAENVLPGHEMDLFTVVMQIARNALNPRNQFAHDIWAWSPDIPDGVLFIEQPETMTFILSLDKALREKRRARGMRYNPRHIWVYRSSDIEEVIRDLNKAHGYLAKFRFAVVDRSQDIRDELYRQLSREPEIAEVLSRLDSRRQTPP